MTTKTKTKIGGGMWLVITGIIYLIAGGINQFVYQYTDLEYIQIAWVLVMWLPLIVPMRRWVDIPTYWEILKDAR